MFETHIFQYENGSKHVEKLYEFYKNKEFMEAQKAASNIPYML
jgi:hypothetical protein